MKTSPFKVRIELPPKAGNVSIINGREGIRVEVPEREPFTINENQAKILRELDQAPEGLIAAELSRRLGMTHAGVLFLMKALQSANLVDRATLQGGGVLYYTTARVTQKLSPELAQVKAELEKKHGKQIENFRITELNDAIKELPAETRDALKNWLLDGGWQN